MKITRDLVMRYLRGELDAYEAGKISAWLDENPEAPAQWLDEEAWNEVAGNDPRKRKDAPAKRVFMQIRWRMAGVAAALLFLLAGSWFMFEKNDGRAQIKTERGMVKKLVNSSTEILAYTLPDGSVTELHPGASLEFDELAFNAAERRLLLKGVARFVVAKDSTRPFSVESGKWVTTALGTIFEVSTGSTDSFYIRLEEGRIKIASEISSDQTLAYYLQPGEIFTERKGDAGNGWVSKEKTTDGQREAGEENIQTPKPKASWAFEHIPVTDLLRHLEKAYSVNITFRMEDDPAENDFTGTLYRDDSLETQLSLVCNLNGWQWEKTDSSYNIRK